MPAIPSTRTGRNDYRFGNHDQTGNPGTVFESLASVPLARAEPVALSIQKREEIWLSAVEDYRARVMEGLAPSAAITQTTNRLWERFPQISDSPDAAKRQLYRKISRVEQGQGLHDLRSAANKAKRAGKLSREDRKAFLRPLIYGKHYGNLDTAWRECLKKGTFSQELLARLRQNPKAPACCPKSVRRQFPRKLIKRMLDIAHRPRRARQSGPFIICRHDDYYAGDWFTSDDFTLELYYAPPPGDERLLCRGQFLPVADCRAKKILFAGLVDAEGYRQDEIRVLFRRACTSYGAPRTGIHVENGMWRKGRLIGGKTFDSIDEDKRNFADRLGIRLVNSLPASPRGKIIENIGKLLQAQVRGQPWWVGPDEKRRVFEHSQQAIHDVLSGRKTAAEAGFLSLEEWFSKLRDVIIPEYNATKQLSKVFGGDREVYMSPDEAWANCQPKDANGNVIGMDYLSDELHWLFDHREIKPIARNGIKLPYCGGVSYKGGDSGQFPLGSDVVVYFNPEKPERIHISDLYKEQWGTIPLDTLVPRWTATREELAEANSRIKAHDSYGRMLLAEIKSEYKAPARQIVADAKSLEIGRQMKVREAAMTFVSQARQKARDDLAEFLMRSAESDQWENAHRVDFI
jgi:hypothetical protein